MLMFWLVSANNDEFLGFNRSKDLTLNKKTLITGIHYFRIFQQIINDFVIKFLDDYIYSWMLYFVNKI